MEAFCEGLISIVSPEFARNLLCRNLPEFGIWVSPEFGGVPGIAGIGVPELPCDDSPIPCRTRRTVEHRTCIVALAPK